MISELFKIKVLYDIKNHAEFMEYQLEKHCVGKALFVQQGSFW